VLVRPDRSKKPWNEDPELRAFTESTEIPDSFPAASEFRRAGYSTYLAIFGISPEELAALEDTIGPDATRAIQALRQGAPKPLQFSWHSAD
jgi:hypothetical protein